MPRVGGHDGSAQLDAWDLAAGYRQRGECLEPEDVCHPGRREPVVDRSAELVSQFAECLVAARLHDRGADPHALSPSVRPPPVRSPARDLILAAACRYPQASQMGAAKPSAVATVRSG